MRALSSLVLALALALASMAAANEAAKREVPAPTLVRSSTTAAGDELGSRVFSDLLAASDANAKKVDLAGVPSGSR